MLGCAVLPARTGVGAPTSLAIELVDELYAPQIASAIKAWIGPFRASFPDSGLQGGRITEAWGLEDYSALRAGSRPRR